MQSILLRISQMQSEKNNTSSGQFLSRKQRRDFYIRSGVLIFMLNALLDRESPRKEREQMAKQILWNMDVLKETVQAYLPLPFFQ